VKVRWLVAQTRFPWVFWNGKELDVDSIDWSESLTARKGKKRTEEARFAKLNITKQKGYVWMVPPDGFVIL
jgi:hypothetical protein